MPHRRIKGGDLISPGSRVKLHEALIKIWVLFLCILVRR
uniref:Uncharacterized protein n=1 Tax=Siphoviridae sp. ctX926 TaxID=2826366 RepID=A0A8S5M143_9CAUD|nr:MAG TPA: hypothetical protein [Siphoviridae sp. ctX926]